ncbi:MAG: lytic polysaccharide monooxygenase [Thermodesulfobacteriota bacterium]
METPVSRIYNCYLEGPENPKSAACVAAVGAGGKQALYDWNGVNQANANDDHKAVVPDGELCSGGNELFKGMEIVRDDWHTTVISPGPDGNFEFVFLATAPHKTKYFRFFVTKDGYDPLGALKWSDLEAAPFCTVTSVELVNGRYRMKCPLPDKSGKGLIYAVWQRADSPEAFYTCMDVEFSGGTPVAWRSLGELRAHQDLAPGDKVTFRLFDAQSGDAGTYTVELGEGEAGAGDWPFFLAEEVNGNSTLVKIGVLGPDGNITPVHSSQENSVYVSSTAEYSFQVDIDMADNGGGDGGEGGGDGGGGCDCGCEGHPGGEADYVYPDGLGSYEEGTVVLGSDGDLYRCRPFPNSGWCNQSELYYAPGTGLAWGDAWVRLD